MERDVLVQDYGLHSMALSVTLSFGNTCLGVNSSPFKLSSYPKGCRLKSKFSILLLHSCIHEDKKRGAYGVKILPSYPGLQQKPNPVSQNELHPAKGTHRRAQVAGWAKELTGSWRSGTWVIPAELVPSGRSWVSIPQTYSLSGEKRGSQTFRAQSQTKNRPQFG